jgi:hypothetical protein
MSPAVTAPPAGSLDPDSVLVGQDLEAQSRELDRQLQSTDAQRELLDRLSADLLADFSRRRTGEWLRSVGRRYPDRPEEAAVASAMVSFTLFRLHDGDAGRRPQRRHAPAG